MAAKWKFSLLAISAVVLSACSSVANKTPDEMYRYSMQRQFKQDSQYNFTGKVALDVLPETNAEARNAELEKLIEVEKNMAEWRYDDEPEMQKPEKIRERAENKLASKEMYMQHFFTHITLPISGAVDLPSGKLEMVPEIRYETRNAISSVKLPMLLDAKSASLIIDPSAVSPFLDMAKQRVGDTDGEPLNNRYVRITAPDELRDKAPWKDLFKALPKAFDDGYATYDKSAFTLLPLDERAKKLGATHRISIKTSAEDSDKMGRAIFNSLIEQLKQKQQDNTAQSNIKAENYTKFIETLSKIKETKPDTAADEKVQKLLKDLTTEVYVNNQGRLLSYVQSAVLPDEVSDKLSYGKKLRVQYEMDLNYNKAPVFVIQPNETNTVDFKKIFPKVGEKLETLGKESASAFQSSETENSETETESVEVETEEPQYIEWKK